MYWCRESLRVRRDMYETESLATDAYSRRRKNRTWSVKEISGALAGLGVFGARSFTVGRAPVLTLILDRPKWLTTNCSQKHG
jgi:hypothetical protein